MDPEQLPESPRIKAGLFSRLFFWWMTPLFLKGRKKQLRLGDLYKLPDADRSECLGDVLENAWESEVSNCGETKKPRKPSFLRVLLRVYTFRYLLLGFLVGFEELFIQIGQPLCLGMLIRHFEQKATAGNEYVGFLLIGGVILCSMVYPMMHHSYFFQTQRQGMQIRIACSALIYRKSLKMNLNFLRSSSGGQVVNLLSNDVSRFDMVLGHIHFMWVAPIQLALVIYILWGYFGPYGLTGVALLVLFAPLQGLMGKLFGKLRLKTAMRTDKRMRILNEVISAIRVVKMYAWESLFSKMVVDARKDEVCWIKRTAALRAINATLHHISSKIVVFVTLLTYVLSGYSISAEKVFVTMALYNSVRQVFTFFVPLGVSQIAETLISIRRIQEFLLGPEKLNDTESNQIANPPEFQELAVRVDNLDAAWDEQSTLSGISFSIPKKSLLLVVGQTGSGKSSLLQVLLRELLPSKGTCGVNGKVAYASQEAWIFEGSVKQNILFGKPYDKDWYNRVVDVCALRRDLQLFPYGDETLVGDKGTCLSGGQRARINLARAVYANADVVLLDDPLSAVDTKVAKHIFTECICGVLKTKTCILVTHQTQFLPNADRILLLENGFSAGFGTYDELLAKGVKFSKKLEEEQEDEAGGEGNKLRKPVTDEVQPADVTAWKKDLVSESDDEFEELESSSDDSKTQKAVEESISTSNKSGKLYWKYFHAGAGLLGILFLVFSNVVTQVLFTGSDYWLQIWVKSEESRYNNVLLATTKNTTNSTDEESFKLFGSNRESQLWTYGVLFGSLVVASLVRTIFYFIVCMSASVNLHRMLFASILRAPMKFFEDHSIGKILNVLAKDMGIVDDLLPVTLFEALEAALNVLGVLVIVSVVNSVLLGPSAVVVILLVLIRRLYLRTARNVKRLEGVAKGPVFSHMSSSLNGLVTIRAFQAEQAMRKQFDTHQNLHSSAWFLVLSTTRWLAFIVEFISIMFISCVTSSFLLFNSDGASIGLAISSAMTLTGMFQWGVRQSAETESQMISVERVTQYSKIQPEPSLESESDKKPDPSWPSHGRVSFKNVSVSFGPEKPVLHNLNFTVEPGEKVGIVGRTGAGKSTLISSLFRLVDVTSGSVEIDGLTISDLGLHDFRPKISIIPQEPVLFNGTLRRNLDPRESHGEEENWDVVRKVNLQEAVKSLPGGLDSEVVDRGSNFSVGQKQLICLGRALLQKNKILVLDEATASLDKETDGLVQQTIRKNFSDCTILTIAHRLDTIIDSDRILVLDAGRVVEFDTPFNLLSDKGGHFYKMVEQLGPSAVDSFFLIARKGKRIRHN